MIDTWSVISTSEQATSWFHIFVHVESVPGYVKYFSRNYFPRSFPHYYYFLLGPFPNETPHFLPSYYAMHNKSPFDLHIASSYIKYVKSRPKGLRFENSFCNCTSCVHYFWWKRWCLFILKQVVVQWDTCYNPLLSLRPTWQDIYHKCHQLSQDIQIWLPGSRSIPMFLFYE